MLRYLPLLLVPAVATADTKPAPSPVPFAAKLDGQLGKQSGNLLYSPASIAMALAMVREGARGRTAAEMDAVLGADNAAAAKALLASFKSPPAKPGEPMPPELAIANRIFADQATPFEQAFLDVTRKDYLAPAEVLDFRKHADDARATINKWVAGVTHDKIKDLLGTGTVDAATRMVLVNAIYLKAQWQTPFVAGATKPAKFAVSGAAAKQVPTMHTVAYAKWGEHGGARMLDLPYAAPAGGPRLGMLLVVPDGKDLASVEATYAKDGFTPFMTAVKAGGKADVALPKFELGTTFELTGVLDKLGMKLALSDDADFKGISSVPTKISKVIHKAWAKVDEKGTEAAAATAVVMTEITSVEIQQPHPFAVDRSFMFFIHDDHGNVLFGGRVIDPAL